MVWYFGNGIILISGSMSIFKWIISFLAMLSLVKADNRTFIYADKSTDEGYGFKSWIRVEPSQYYFNWSRYVNADVSSNKCQWDSLGQSPINIIEPEDDQCNGTLPHDKHRWQTDHGTCRWKDLTWEIKPWGLFMQFPMPESGNFEQIPCRKPSINSSGGLADRFFATHITVKSKSEHFLLGKQYDAEINIAHTRYYEEDYPFSDPNNETIFIASILVNANETNGDNPIFEPYLREWFRIYENITAACDLLLKTEGNMTNVSAAHFQTEQDLREKSSIPHSTRRKVQDDGPGDGFMQGEWARWPKFDVYHLLTTPWFYRYRGSLTMPNCITGVFWRVLEQPLEISVRQLTMINQMISYMKEPTTCFLTSAGAPREDEFGYVDVNRPIYEVSKSHKLMHCDKFDFPSTKFFNNPRGNTGWSLVEKNMLGIPENYWWRTFDDYNRTSIDGPGNITALTERERNATEFFLLYGTLLTSAPTRTIRPTATVQPTAPPSTSMTPTFSALPTTLPSMVPTRYPTLTIRPTTIPSRKPTDFPTKTTSPSVQPSFDRNTTAPT